MENPTNSLTRAVDDLFVGVTSFKLWMIIFFLFKFGQALHTCWITFSLVIVIGTLAVCGILYLVKIPPASKEFVTGFFGANSRPAFSHPEFSLPQPGGIKNEPFCLRVVGHRGAGIDAPENSISAFRQCKARGCVAVEFDVSVSKDGVPVVFHDDNLMRMTGIDREVSDMTVEELKQVDISVRHPTGEKFKGERIPTLEEVVTTCMSLGLKFFIDLKDNDPRIVDIMVDFYKRHPEMYRCAAITSFATKIIYMIRRKDPKIIGCMASRPCFHTYKKWNECWTDLEYRHDFILHIGLDMLWDAFDDFAFKYLYWWLLGISAFLVNKDSIAKEESYHWTNKGIRLYLATVNSPSEKAHVTQNVQLGYLTDTLQ